jgi:hypothetical protein
MASLPPFQQIQFQQVPGAPPWFAGFLTAINPWIQSVYSALNANLTIPQNIPGQDKTIAFTVPSTGYTAQTFTWTTPAKPVSVMIAQCTQTSGTVAANPTAGIALNQWSAQGSMVSLDSIAGLQPGVSYSITFSVR